MSERRYWIGVVSQEDADKAVAQGFVQFGFGRAEPLERMQPGDGVTFYSPRAAPQTGALVQACEQSGIELHDADDAMLAAVSPRLEPAVREVLTVPGSLASRDGYGGTSPRRVAEQRGELVSRTQALSRELGL